MNTGLEQTRCPHCNIAFHVNATQLKAAQGTVRCGICLNLFDAVEHSCQPQITPPAEQASDSPESASEHTEIPAPVEPDESDEPDEPDEVEDIYNSPDKSSNIEASAGETDTSNETADIASAEPQTPTSIDTGPLSLDLDKLARNLAQASDTALEPAENKAPPPEPSPSPRRQITRLLGLSASGILLTALLLQLIFHYSARLSLNPDYRPVVELLCSQLGCAVAEMKDTTLISVEAVSIQSHPSVQEALTMEAILVNRAPYAQPFPETTLVFEDIRGQTLARRSFGPEQYLPDNLKGIRVMQPSLAYQIRLELAAPDQQAVSYSLIVNEK